MSESIEAIEVRTKVEEWVEAVGQADVDRVVSLYSPETSMFDVGVPLRSSGVDAIRSRLQEWIGGYGPGGPGYEVRDLDVHASGDVAYATGLGHVSGELKTGDRVDMWVRMTLGFQKDGGVWRIAHEHMSVPIDFQTLKASFDANP